MNASQAAFDWQEHQRHWSLRSDTLYLNHGSFGPPPSVVIEARRRWQAMLDEQPMDFFVRQYEPAWFAARDALAKFVGADRADLVFVDNATAGMNVVADSFPLQAGDEVLLTDHEYGAVRRTWQRACDRQAAVLAEVELPTPFTSIDDVVQSIVDAITPRTRILVVSHITSATAITLPITEICRALRPLGVAVCVDGPHAVAQLPLDLQTLGADFYTASCHKWLCAPFGSGFLWVAPEHQKRIQPTVLSWGRIQPNVPENWSDEFVWSGTHDPAVWFTVPTAIDFLEQIGWNRFRQQTHALASYARRRLAELSGLQPLVSDDQRWYSCMAHVPLPPGDAVVLQNTLWQRHRVEIPIICWKGRRFIRVSCHLYNEPSHIDRLVNVLNDLLRAEAAL